MAPRTLLVFTPHRNSKIIRFEDCAWQTVVADNVESAQQLISKHNIEVALYHVTETDTLAYIEVFLERLHTKNRQLYWIAIVGKQQLEDPDVQRYITTLFYDYHTLPCHAERLTFILGHLFGMTDMLRKLPCSVKSTGSWQGMVGESVVMKSLFRSIEKISESLAPVLINGESGTGKELIAQAIHATSKRSGRCIIDVNCGAISRDLMQSEFFGHEKGAFTGAERRKIGCIEAANGGTLFLDEIGDLPLELQVNLLRFVQEGAIKRVGSNELIHVDVRIIAATHRELDSAVKTGTFRKDLYYRLNVLHLNSPSLRDRGHDIVRLADVYLKLFSNETLHRKISFSPSAILALKQYDWPGNVRELINLVRRAIVMSDNAIISAEDLNLQTSEGESLAGFKLDDIRNRSEYNAIFQALSESDNNVTQAAKMLDISRRSLYRLMDKHTIA